MPKNQIRTEVLKTYKMYVDGKFPRTESGRYYKLNDSSGKLIANICWASRKDFRDAVVAARKAASGWQNRSAYNRGQIIYRIAETLEGRKAQFTDTLIRSGISKAAATAEVTEAIDLVVSYAGWSDKYQQLFSSVNPVESSHFNFSVPEPTGVVTFFPPAGFGLIGVLAGVLPVICGGNTTIVIADQHLPLPAIDFAEVLHASDVPAGVINILTGKTSELIQPAATHKDVNAVFYGRSIDAHYKVIGESAKENVKRVVSSNWKGKLKDFVSDPYLIMEFQEIKTTWHPIGQ